MAIKNFEFQTEAWSEYSIGVLLIFTRLFVRIKSVGFKGWNGDDFLILLVLGFWTAELTMLQLIGTQSFAEVKRVGLY